jgi:hypothetical protein
LASPPASSGNIVDLFGPADAAQQAAQPTNALDDLLQLGNPFADMFGAQAPPQQQQQPAGNNQWMSNGEPMIFDPIFLLPLSLCTPLLLYSISMTICGKFSS